MNYVDKYGNVKIVLECILLLILKKCVDLIIIDMVVMEVILSGFIL